MATPRDFDNSNIDQLIRSGSATPLAIAESYAEAGLSVIPIPHRKKKPTMNAWQNLRATPAQLPGLFAGGAANIGVLLGEASGGLVDVDLDCIEALRLAPGFLPPTGWVFGRASTPSAHWVFRVTGDIPRLEAIKDIDGTMMIEARGTGHQTVFPGSVHECGERIEFNQTGPIAVLSWAELKAAVSKLASATLLARHWPKQGSRHDASLALAGALLRAGWEDQTAERFIESVVTVAGDAEAQDRIRAVASTRARLEQGETVKGLPTLAEILGDKVASKLSGLLRLREHRTVSELPIPYFTDAHGTWWQKPTRDGYINEHLANFRAEIVTDITETDGVEERRTFEVYVAGIGEPQVLTLKAEEFAPMNWVLLRLGAGAILAPGPSRMQHLRCAIQQLSKNTERRRTHGHTGWAKVNGQDVFLHAGGAIGEAGPIGDVATCLEGALSGFRLPVSAAGEDLYIAADDVLALLNLGPRRVILPLLAAAARAVFGATDFSLFLVGPTGTFKSETASIFQRFFGAGFDARHLPGSWTSTGNALEEQAFLAKDVLLTVDDFKPSGDQSDVRLYQLADRLFRAAGNGSARVRMRADTSLRSARPPRSLILATGEELPAGESLRARLVTIPIDHGAISTAELTKAQARAANGLYSQVMAAFIQWCAGRLPALRDELSRRAAELRPIYQGAHARTAGAFAELEVSLDIFLRFICEATGGVTLMPREASMFVEELQKELLGMVVQQHAEIAEADPVRRFLELISSALASGQAHIAARDGAAPESPEAWGWRRDGNISRAHGTRIGWTDRESLYLDCDAAYRVAKAHVASAQGVSITAATLRKRLAERGLLVSTDKARGVLLIRVMLEGRRRNVLHLRTQVLDGFGSASQPSTTESKPTHPSGTGTDQSAQSDQQCKVEGPGSE